MLKRLLDLIYPRTCVACKRPLSGIDTPICINCIIDLPVIINDTLQQKKINQKFDGKVNIADAKSYLLFEKGNVAQKLIHSLKYQNKQEVGIWLGKKFGDALLKIGKRDSFDLIVPIPLHAEKKKQRGYNQAILIAEGMSEILNIPVVKSGLIKMENNTSQTKKSRYQRYKNTSDIFKVDKTVNLQGKKVCLVDDVLTTGSTLEAAANVLIEAKCEVYINTIASAF